MTRKTRDWILGIVLLLVALFLCGVAAKIVWFDMGYAYQDSCEIFRNLPISRVPVSCLEKWGMMK